jgi:phenylalanyl-tRNA synthetase beta chain
MKASLSWLSEYVDTSAGPNELARRLTMAGLEVEGVVRGGDGLSGVVVAQIKESEKHPNADKLSVTKVDVGGPALLQVVCGAKNYKVGDKVPLATAGAVLPNGMEIKVSPLRGVESFGMLCSARELGLSEDAAGLLILDPSAKLGAPIADALGLDTVLELNVTPNRPDALSHLGVARELSVLLDKALKAPKPPFKEEGGKASDRVKIRIEDAKRCPRYAARIIEGVKVGPSPKWMVDRLKACGVRAINNVVDVTNYVLLEYGQPLHGFDLDKIAGGEIVVRTAKPKEKLTTLDGKERELDADDLLICDRDRAHVLAGVMGGAASEVSDATTRVLLECANFEPATVRRASKRHALHTESSHRFERGADVSVVPEVLDRAAALIAELAGGKVLEGRVDVYPTPVKPRTVQLRHARVSSLIGAPIPADDTRRILKALGFELQGAQGETETYSVPLRRVDVDREVDLIEEIARIRGYDAVPLKLPKSPEELVPAPRSMQIDSRIRDALSGAGLHEVVNYSFVSPKELAALGETEKPIALLNPLSDEHAVMRTTLYAGLLQNVSRNVRHQVEDVRLYEIGRAYTANPEGGKGAVPPAHERKVVAGVLYGKRDERKWTGKDEPVDFYDAKGAVESVLSSLHVVGADLAPIQSPYYHPRASAAVKLGGKVAGHLGELHPSVAKKLDLPAGVFLFELDVEVLGEKAQLTPAFHSLHRFPAVRRDLAVVVPAELAHRDLQKLILEVGAPLVEEARVFDVYTGKPIPEGKKNVAYALSYRSAERTLTDAEVTEAHQRIVEEVGRRLGGSLRA